LILGDYRLTKKGFCCVEFTVTSIFTNSYFFLCSNVTFIAIQNYLGFEVLAAVTVTYNSTLNVEALFSSETLDSFRTTRRYTQENRDTCNVRSADVKAVTMKSTIVWDVLPCSLVEIYWCFGGRICSSDSFVNLYQPSHLRT
jgi:hypothetical protein